MDSERALRIATLPFGGGRGTSAREGSPSVPDLAMIDDAWAEPRDLRPIERIVPASRPPTPNLGSSPLLPAFARTGVVALAENPQKRPMALVPIGFLSKATPVSPVAPVLSPASLASGGPEALRSTRAEPLASQARAAAEASRGTPAIVLVPSSKIAKNGPQRVSSMAGVPSLLELVDARREWEAERERLRRESEPPPSGVVTKSSRPAPDVLAVPETPSAFPLAELPPARPTPRDHRDARLTFGMGMLCGALLVALALVAVVFSR